MSEPTNNLPEDLSGKLPNIVEEGLKQKLNSYSLKKCDSYVKTLRECTHKRLISILWACKPQVKELNECLGKYNTEENLNKLRHRFLEGKLYKNSNYEELQKKINSKPV